LGEFKLKDVSNRLVLAVILSASMAGLFGCGGKAANATSQGPGPQPTPTLSAHSVDLTWVSSPSPNLVGYRVYRGSNTGGPYANVSPELAASVLTFTDSTVASGQHYFYVVTSIDMTGVESAPSGEVTATIPTP
jgi:hypothetical protein